eukprot:CAMPEP_0194118424 /NCGR_PEP_ID=MMETSP0150-20130528/35398_1 /TAXON_ID=122233 /ORGANISM="Chaetoceros debilis, Strain MM31A-1" /LENGTH=813 /DNA_ID=CAMNT_0038809787 /DNA_START=34 /DNA_END=2475 /DNA_ORIENTATION=+
MKLSVAGLTLLSQSAIVATAFTLNTHTHAGIGLESTCRQHNSRNIHCGLLSAVPPRGGLSFEEDTKESSATSSPSSSASDSDSTPASGSGSGSGRPLQNRGKLNEIDFCMSPSDVSISRLYQTSSNGGLNMNQSSKIGEGQVSSSSSSSSDAPTKIMSLTRALNNASNRAVRRILLSRSWPSPEALNYSLRQVLSAQASSPLSEKDEVVEDNIDDESSTTNSDGKSGKCPVPRPILNIIIREAEMVDDADGKSSSDSVITDGQVPTTSSPLGKRGGTEEQWVEDQLRAFRETYGEVKGYEFAEAFMESILSLATKGVESDRVAEVLKDGVYEDAYRRIISVLKSVGVTFEGVDADDDTENSNPKMKIASKMRDEDICLSMLDKLNIQNEMILGKGAPGFVVEQKKNTVDEIAEVEVEVEEETSESESLEEVDQIMDANSEDSIVDAVSSDDVEVKKEQMGLGKRILSWIAPQTAKNRESKTPVVEEEEDEKVDDVEAITSEPEVVEEEETVPEDLGGVLLSAEEPTVTRQLNVLSNIVKRTLLFGGDQELLVLSKTLEADQPAFIQRWYPGTSNAMSGDVQNEARAGVQFFNCLVQLLKEGYSNGVVTTLDPLLPLAPSYTNSYERLTADLVELGSGYINPTQTKKIPTNIPKTPTEELIRFSQWEVALRQIKPDVSGFPEDLVGTWQVKDEIGGKVIGTSTVVFKPEGEVVVNPPLKGLTWKLDPGPTHLDTCTFQVLSEDGAILQYRGFMDRGARLESRFSKRSIKIRGAVSFKMRDGGEGDILPIVNQSGATRFSMSKVFDLDTSRKIWE